MLASELAPRRSGSAIPLFNVVVSYQSPSDPAEPRRSAHLGDLRRFDVPPATSRFDLEVQFTDTGDELEAEVTYNPALFRFQTISSLLERFLLVIRDLVADPDRPVAEAGARVARTSPSAPTEREEF
jgi:hypothetical protein